MAEDVKQCENVFDWINEVINDDKFSAKPVSTAGPSQTYTFSTPSIWAALFAASVVLPVGPTNNTETGPPILLAPVIVAKVELLITLLLCSPIT